MNQDLEILFESNKVQDLRMDAWNGGVTHYCHYQEALALCLIVHDTRLTVRPLCWQCSNQTYQRRWQHSSGLSQLCLCDHRFAPNKSLLNRSHLKSMFMIPESWWKLQVSSLCPAAGQIANKIRCPGTGAMAWQSVACCSCVGLELTCQYSCQAVHNHL